MYKKTYKMETSSRKRAKKYQQRKAEGKIKKLSYMMANEKLFLEKQNRESVAVLREKKKT